MSSSVKIGEPVAPLLSASLARLWLAVNWLVLQVLTTWNWSASDIVIGLIHNSKT